jgi:hypothetical protein
MNNQYIELLELYKKAFEIRDKYGVIIHSMIGNRQGFNIESDIWDWNLKSDIYWTACLINEKTGKWIGYEGDCKGIQYTSEVGFDTEKEALEDGFILFEKWKNNPLLNDNTRRLFIELEEVDDKHLKSLAKCFNIKDDDWKFDKIFDSESVYDIYSVLDSIEESDEIYADTALVNSLFSMGSGNLFNSLMHHAISRNIKDKKIFIFRKQKEIHWDNLKRKLFISTFVNNNNQLFVIDEDTSDCYKWKLVDVSSIIEEM